MSKRKFYLTKLAYMGVFAALCAILNIFTFKVTEGFMITFSASAAFMAGAFLGPVSGLIVAGLGDIVGCIIRPLGAYMPTITLASSFLGLIPGLVFRYAKHKPNLAITLSFVLTLLICTIALNTTTLWWVYSRATGKTYWVYLIARLPVQGMVSIANLAICFMLYEPLKNKVFSKYLLMQESLAKTKSKNNSKDIAVAPTASGEILTQPCKEVLHSKEEVAINVDTKTANI